jgi:LPS sulfotransferase NodH
LGDEPLRPGELAFDYDGIATLVRQAEAEDAAIGQFFAASGLAPFRVVYEEFSPRYEETIFALLRWLGVTPPPDLALPDPRTVKLADDRTEEWFARFRELQTASTPSTPD